MVQLASVARKAAVQKKCLTRIDPIHHKSIFERLNDECGVISRIYQTRCIFKEARLSLATDNASLKAKLEKNCANRITMHKAARLVVNAVHMMKSGNKTASDCRSVLIEARLRLAAEHEALKAKLKKNEMARMTMRRAAQAVMNGVHKVILGNKATNVFSCLIGDKDKSDIASIDESSSPDAFANAPSEDVIADHLQFQANQLFSYMEILNSIGKDRDAGSDYVRKNDEAFADCKTTLARLQESCLDNLKMCTYLDSALGDQRESVDSLLKNLAASMERIQKLLQPTSENEEEFNASISQLRGLEKLEESEEPTRASLLSKLSTSDCGADELVDSSYQIYTELQEALDPLQHEPDELQDIVLNALQAVRDIVAKLDDVKHVDSPLVNYDEVETGSSETIGCEDLCLQGVDYEELMDDPCKESADLIDRICEGDSFLDSIDDEAEGTLNSDELMALEDAPIRVTSASPPLISSPLGETSSQSEVSSCRDSIEILGDLSPNSAHFDKVLLANKEVGNSRIPMPKRPSKIAPPSQSPNKQGRAIRGQPSQQSRQTNSHDKLISSNQEEPLQQYPADARSEHIMWRSFVPPCPSVPQPEQMLPNGARPSIIIEESVQPQPPSIPQAALPNRRQRRYVHKQYTGMKDLLSAVDLDIIDDIVAENINPISISKQEYEMAVMDEFASAGLREDKSVNPTSASRQECKSEFASSFGILMCNGAILPSLHTKTDEDAVGGQVKLQASRGRQLRRNFKSNGPVATESSGATLLPSVEASHLFELPSSTGGKSTFKYHLGKEILLVCGCHCQKQKHHLGKESLELPKILIEGVGVPAS